MSQTRLEQSLIGKKINGMRITDVLDVQFVGHSLTILVALEDGSTHTIKQGTEAGRLQNKRQSR